MTSGEFFWIQDSGVFERRIHKNYQSEWIRIRIQIDFQSKWISVRIDSELINWFGLNIRLSIRVRIDFHSSGLIIHFGFIQIKFLDSIGLIWNNFQAFFNKRDAKRFPDWFGLIRIGSDTDIGMIRNSSDWLGMSYSYPKLSSECVTLFCSLINFFEPCIESSNFSLSLTRFVSVFLAQPTTVLLSFHSQTLTPRAPGGLVRGGILTAGVARTPILSAGEPTCFQSRSLSLCALYMLYLHSTSTCTCTHISIYMYFYVSMFHVSTFCAILPWFEPPWNPASEKLGRNHPSTPPLFCPSWCHPSWGRRGNSSCGRYADKVASLDSRVRFFRSWIRE